MRRSLTLPLILLGAGAIACVAAGYSLWRRYASPSAVPPTLAIVSGSSLAETLHGETVRGTCSACGFPLRFAAESLPRVGDVLCPNCGEAIGIENLTPSGADRVAVRVLDPGESPKIGGLYVFAAPEGGDAAPVVKRIVAEPGKQVSIEGGDLFLDDDRVRKDPRDESNPRIVVHEELAVDGDGSPFWTTRTLPDGRIERSFGAQTVWSTERRPTPVLDSYPSQAVERRRLNAVPDVWMVGEVRGDRPVEVSFAYRSEARAYRLDVRSDGSWSGSLDDLPHASGSLSDWSDREAFRFGMLDRQIFLVRPDREAIVLPLEEGVAVPSPAPLSIVVAKEATLSHLGVERDVHYLPPRGAEEPWDEPKQGARFGWFALGDYPSFSYDSRHFGRFSSEALLGEALLPPMVKAEVR